MREVKQMRPEPSTENYRQLRNAEGRRNSFSGEKVYQWVSAKNIHVIEQGSFINTKIFT